MNHSFLKSLKDEFHKSRVVVFVVFSFFMAATFSFLATSNPTSTSAAPVQGFNPGNIISDAVMADYNSMTVAEIQAFLTSKNSCNNTNYQLYLDQTNAYKTVSWHWSGSANNGHFVCLSEERFGEGTTIGSGQTAAEIIYEAAQTSRINPKVLIVLLEKEQGLISDTFPHSGQYRAATGYGCPDTAACDSKYYGFKNQVFRAAELFRYTLDNGYYLYPENKSGVFVAYNPSSYCGGTNVLIENRATAALYRYTPYQPNAAALAAGYGNGDSCSAYGNRNFYLFFTNWFGSTQAKVDADQIIIPDGEYSLTAQSSTNLALGSVGNSNGANVELAKVDDSNKAQRWSFKRDTATNTYTLTNLATGKVLDLHNNKTTAGTNVQIWDGDGSCGQRWKIYRSDDNGLIVESTCASGMVVDLSKAAANGVNAELNVFSGSSATQKWTLRTGQTVSEGVYSINSARDKKYGLDVNEASTKSGADVHFWTFLGNYNQLWHFEYHADSDEYTITNPYSGHSLDIESANYRSGTNIQIYTDNSTCAQRWKVAKTSDDAYYLMAACNYGYSVDLQNDPANGNGIRIWETNDTPNQKWIVTPATQGAINDGIYTIASKDLASTALDINEASTKNGANVYLWNLHGNYNQLWRVTYNASSDDYSIINPYSGKALDLSEGKPANNQNIQIYTDNSTCAQRWKITKTSDGFYNILSVCDESYALDLAGSIMKPSSNLVVWPKQNTESQKWQFRR